MEQRAVAVALVSGLFAFVLTLGTVSQGRPLAYLQVAEVSTVVPTGGDTANSTSAGDTTTVATSSTDGGGSTTSTGGATYEAPVISGTTVPSTDTSDGTNTTSPTAPLYVPCPFAARADRTLIDLTKGGTVPVQYLMLRADSALAQATRAWSGAPIAPGRYRVSLASYADASATGSIGANDQRWFLTLLDPNGTTLLTTPATRDIADTETTVEELVMSTATLATAATRAVARHYAYPSSTPNPFAPLCAALDRLGDLPLPTGATSTSSTGDTTGVATSTAAATNSTPTTTVEVYHACPIPQRVGRTIVDLTKGGTVPLASLVLRAVGSRAAASHGPVAAFVPKGLYDIRLASYANSAEPASASAQSWYVQLTDGHGALVGTTSASADIPTWQPEFVSRVAERYAIARDVAALTAVHAAYPASTPDGFMPLCASFDRVGDLPQAVAPEAPAIAAPDAAIAPAAAPVVVPPPAALPAPAPVEDANSGVVGTRTRVLPQSPRPSTVVPLQDPRTTAGAPTSTREALVAVPPASIGVGGALRDVRVPVPVAERREAVTRTVGANVFTALAVAPSAERARIVAALVATSSTSSTAAVQALVRAVGTSSAVAPAEAEHAVARRGLDALRDTDGDGISDFDEREIYHTDPNDPFTAHGVLSDGERVLLGLDPRTRDLTPVPVASPQEEGTTTADLFTVGAITLATSSDPAAAGGAAGIHITGTADPFAFVTLFVYSTPVVVTVRADVTGTYDYTLDTSLADGSHELYVASVDNAGRILAKSDPIPFVKTAQAVEYTPPGGTPTRDPASAALQRTVTFALLALLLAAFAVLVGVGVRASRPGTAHEVSIGHDENTPA